MPLKSKSPSMVLSSVNIAELNLLKSSTWKVETNFDYFSKMCGLYLVLYSFIDNATFRLEGSSGQYE